MSENRVVVAHSEIVARTRAVIHEQLRRMPELLDATDCPDDFVEWLAGRVGLDPATELRPLLDVLGLRRFIDSAGQIWREKGDPETTHQLVRMITGGSRTWLGEWAILHHAAGVTDFPIEFTTHDTGDGGHHWVEVHIEDPGVALHPAVLAGLQLLRQYSERFNITFVGFIETWRQLALAGRWAFVGGSDVHNFDNGYLEMGPNGAADQQLLTTDGAAPLPDHATFQSLIRMTGGQVSFTIAQGPGSLRYEVRMEDGVGPDNVEFFRAGSLKATASVPIGDGEDIFFRVLMSPLGDGSLDFRVELHGATVITYNDPTPLDLDRPSGWFTYTGTAVLSVLWYEIVPQPAVTAILNE